MLDGGGGGRIRIKIEHRDEYGHCNVPKRFKSNPSLGEWVLYQRQQYRLFRKGSPSQMTEERIGKLEVIGFKWDGRCCG